MPKVFKWSHFRAEFHVVNRNYYLYYIISSTINQKEYIFPFIYSVIYLKLCRNKSGDFTNNHLSKLNVVIL